MCALFPEQRRHLPICELQDTWCRHSRVGVSARTAPAAVLSTPVPSAILPREPGCARKWHYGPMLFLLASWILHIFRDPEERGWGESCKYTPRQHKLRISQFPVKSLFLWKLIHVFIRCVTAGSTSSILLCSWRPALESFKWIKTGLSFSSQFCVVLFQRGWMKSRWQLCNLQRWKHPTERSLAPSELQWSFRSYCAPLPYWCLTGFSIICNPLRQALCRDNRSFTTLKHKFQKTGKILWFSSFPDHFKNTWIIRNM